MKNDININNEINIKIDNNTSNKTKKVQINKKELIITIIVLIVVITLGFIIGKFLFENLYGNI